MLRPAPASGQARSKMRIATGQGEEIETEGIETETEIPARDSDRAPAVGTPSQATQTKQFALPLCRNKNGGAAPMTALPTKRCSEPNPYLQFTGYHWFEI